MSPLRSIFKCAKLIVLYRYCIDLSKGWDFYLLLDPSVLITYYEGPNVSSLWDLGLGIEYRATHLRVSLDAGPSLIVNSYNSDVFTLFFGKLGIGYIF